jgi:L-ascorbate metabolism protein UlaG (beta-lactamase superfamily)
MAILTKDQIFKADDIKSEVVPVEEWGGEVIVQGLTGHQRDEWEKSMTVTTPGKGGRTRRDVDMTDFRARLAVLCVVDEQGQRLFHDGDIHQLAGKSGAALDTVYTVAARLSGISEKDVEDLTKDFGKEPDGGGSSST